MRISLIALGALCAVTLLPATVGAQWAPTTRPAPELYWSMPRPAPPPFTTDTTDFDIEGTDGGFAYLEARPQTGQSTPDNLDDGVWVTLLTRVTFADLASNTDIPPAIRNNTDLNGSPEYDWDDDGDPLTDDHPPAIISQTRFDALVNDLATDTNGEFLEVTRRCQPFVPGSSAAPTTVRWDALYPHWPSNATRALWRSVDIPQAGQIFNLEALIARTITDQTGGAVDGSDFMYRWGHTAYTDSGMTLEFQALFVHGNSDPQFNSQPVPEGPTGTFKVGTSTPLTYIAFGGDPTEDGEQGTSYPVGVGHTPVTGNEFIQAGSGFEFNATLIGLGAPGTETETSSVLVELSSGSLPPWNDPDPWVIYKLSNEPPKIICPAWVPIGTTIKLRRFNTPYGLMDPIPAPDRETFHVGS